MAVNKRDFLAAYSAYDDDEILIPCSDIRPGDTLANVGRVTAVSEPDRDGEFVYVTDDGRKHSALWAGITRKERH